MDTVYFSIWKGIFLPMLSSWPQWVYCKSAVEGLSFIMGTGLCYWKGWFFWVPRIPLSSPPSSFLYSMPSMKTCPLDWGGSNGHRIYLKERVREARDTLALSPASPAVRRAARDTGPDLGHVGQLCTSLDWIAGTRTRKGCWLQF